MRTRPGLRGDGGSLTLELAILTPAILLLLGGMVVVGRVQVAAAGVEHAAAVAARDASLARAAQAAHSAAATAADRELTSLGCVSSTVRVDVAGFGEPLGRPATVTVAITCNVTFGDLALPGLPGSRTLSATSTSPLDSWRQR